MRNKKAIGFLALIGILLLIGAVATVVMKKRSDSKSTPEGEEEISKAFEYNTDLAKEITEKCSYFEKNDLNDICRCLPEEFNQLTKKKKYNLTQAYEEKEREEVEKDIHILYTKVAKDLGFQARVEEITSDNELIYYTVVHDKTLTSNYSLWDSDLMCIIRNKVSGVI